MDLSFYRINTMKIEINPKDTSRAEAFDMWITSPMPMVTLTKTFDVTNLLKISRKLNIKFNVLLCWCVGSAANRIPEFFLLPEKNKLYKYDQLAVNVIVNNCKGGINSCDIPFTQDIKQFADEYMKRTATAAAECRSSFLEEDMIVGTSAMIQTELDSIVNQYTDKFNNPMVMWGRYRKQWFKTVLPISFQFHHVQMDGAHAAAFLERLSKR